MMMMMMMKWQISSFLSLARQFRCEATPEVNSEPGQQRAISAASNIASGKI